MFVCMPIWVTKCVVCVRVRVHAQMMLVYSNIHREATAQVKGAAKIMVTVVATKELKAGNLLRRFKAQAAQDEPRRGNSNDRCHIYRIHTHTHTHTHTYIYILSMFGDCFVAHGIFSLY